MSYELTIGLEIHLKVKSATKLFCRCQNSQDMEMLVPNTNICPVCTGQPGALPVLSYEPMIKSLLMGRALKCTIHNTSAFDRKSYFYPDLPMGYQITQFHSPTMTDGQVEFFNEDFSVSERVSIQQIQMETDTAKAIHTQGSSLIDYNRAATPLIEIVTRPEFHSATQVAAFLKELQRIARYNDISDADMEKGQMRVDVNISISPVIPAQAGISENKDSGSSQGISGSVSPEGHTTKKLGIRNEIKNMNSISAIMRAIEHEYNRQVAVLDAGGTIDQATRRRDDVAGESFVMRSKEDALDYRYFPEPDLPPLHLDRETLDELEAMPLHIPALIIHRFTTEKIQKDKFSKEYINAIINDKDTLDYFLACVDNDGCDAKETVKWIAGQILAYMKFHFITINELKFNRGEFVKFIEGISSEKIEVPEAKNDGTERVINMNEISDAVRHNSSVNSRYKKTMEYMLATGDTFENGNEKHKNNSNDDEIISTIQKILADNPSIVEQYKGGKETAIGFFVGQVMKALAGKIDPNKAKSLLEVELRK